MDLRNILSVFNRKSEIVLAVKDNAPAEQAPTIIVNKEVIGVSGTEKFGGVFSEDYFRKLQGSEKAKEYDRMRRGDARIKMCLSAVKNPIRSATSQWIPAENDEISKTHAEFLNFIFKEDICPIGKPRKKFAELLNEALTVVDFGSAIFERAHKVSRHKKFGAYIGLSHLGWRSPKTIEYYHTDEMGNLESVEQQAYGDIRKSVKMPAEFLNLIVLEKEGDNYEGISLLRPCYGAWSRKQTFLKLLAIGVERLALSTPKAKIPAGKEASPEFDAMVNLLEKLTSHQMNYVTYPEGWDIEYLVSNFDPEKVKSVIQFENEEMTYAFLANFLMLGSGGNGGAYALGSSLSDFFTKSILYIAQLISECFEEIGKELIIVNFGEQETYPKFQFDDIEDEISGEFGTLLKNLVDGRMLTPDDGLEEQLRKRLKLVPMREEDKGKRDNSPPNFDFNADLNEYPEPEPDKNLKEWQKRIQLAESNAQKKIGSAQDRVREVMQENLSKCSKNLAEIIMKNYRGLGESNKMDAINGVTTPGSREFYGAIKAVLTDIATESISDARKEVPKAKKVKLAEFEELPKAIQKRVLMQSRLMVTTTLNDLEKVVFLQFGDSVVSTDSEEIIEADILGAGKTYVEGSSVIAAGGNAASRIVNESRSAFFFDEEVSQEIESFTFVNGDPVSEICQSLAGKTFSKDDPEADRLFPPLHHNCKSYIVPNLVGAKDNPPLSPGGLKTKFTPTL